MAATPLVRQRPSPPTWSTNVQGDASAQRLSSYLSANDEYISSTPLRSPSQLFSRSKSPFDFRRTPSDDPSPSGSGSGSRGDGSSLHPRHNNSLSAAWTRFKGRNKSSSPYHLSSPPPSATIATAAGRSQRGLGAGLDGAEAVASKPSARQNQSRMPHPSPTRAGDALPRSNGADIPAPARSSPFRSSSPHAPVREKTSYPPPAASTGTSGPSFRGRVPSLHRRNSSGKPLSAASIDALGAQASAQNRPERADRAYSSHPSREQSQATSQAVGTQSYVTTGIDSSRAGGSGGGSGGGSSVSLTRSSSSLSRFFSTRRKAAADVGPSDGRLGSLVSIDAQAAASSSVAVQPESPPLAIISGEWRDADAARSDHLVTTRSKIQPRAADGVEQVARQRLQHAPQEGGSDRIFSFPPRPSSPDERIGTELAASMAKGQVASSPRNRHAPALSAPLTLSAAGSRRQEPERSFMSTHANRDSAAAPAISSDYARLRAKLSHNQSRRSRSLNKLASFLGGSSSPADENHQGGPSAESGSKIGSRAPSQKDKACLTRPSASELLHRANEGAFSTTAPLTPPSEAPGKLFSQRPSLRARLKMPRFNSSGQVTRPSTPEIESWRQNDTDSTLTGFRQGHGRRASVDAASQLCHDASPVKITRTGSVIRRKPPPNFNLEELTSSSLLRRASMETSSMPRPSEGGGDGVSPPPPPPLPPPARPGARADLPSKASSLESPAFGAASNIPMPRSSSSVSVSKRGRKSSDRGSAQRSTDNVAASLLADVPPGSRTVSASRTHAQDGAEVPSTGGTAALAKADKPAAAAEAAKSPAASALSRPQVIAATCEATKPLMSAAVVSGLLEVPSSAAIGARSSTGSLKPPNVAADMSSDSERPWSLISAGEADTALLRLWKLIVDTNSSGECDDDEVLFFRPLSLSGNGTPRETIGPAALVEEGSEQGAKETITTPTLAQQHAWVRPFDQGGQLDDQLESLLLRSVAVDSEDDGAMGSGRGSFPSTARSDLKHEISSAHSSSMHSSGSSTLKAGHFFAPTHRRPSVAAIQALDASQSQPHPRLGATVAVGDPRVDPRDGPSDHSQDLDLLGPLPTENGSGSRASLTHHRGGSTSTIGSLQNTRRASAVSRLTVSSGHHSEGFLSEDALSALDAEVGQARRAEVVALGKGRVTDWVGDSSCMLARHEGPTLSRSASMRRPTDGVPTARKVRLAATALPEALGRPEVSRQVEMSHQLDERLQRLVVENGQLPGAEEAGPIRDIPDEASSDGVHRRPSPLPPATATSSVAEAASVFDFNSIATRQSTQNKYARLSAFHDRKLPSTVGLGAAEQPQLASTDQHQDEAIRLGRAPSKRMRRFADEVRSSGEAVMISRGPAAPHARSVEGRPVLDLSRPPPAQVSAEVPSSARAVSAVPAALVDLDDTPRKVAGTVVLLDPRIESLGHGMRRSRSEASESTKASDADTLSVVPTSAAAAAATTGSGVPAHASRPDESQFEVGDRRKGSGRQLPSNLTTEEAIAAKQKQRLERDRRHRKREERKQLEQQKKYALKKKSDPLLATRLALVGLQPGAGLLPSKDVGQADEPLRSELPASSKPFHHMDEVAVQLTSPTRQTFILGLDPVLDPSAVRTGPSSSAAGSSSYNLELPRYLSAPSSRQASFVGSVTSFHTAESGSSGENNGDGNDAGSGERDGTAARDQGRGASSISVGRALAWDDGASKDADAHRVKPPHARPPTSASLKTMNSIASSLTVDFEFPIPPQRLREQLSDDGTLLSRAGLREAFWPSPLPGFDFPGDDRQVQHSPSVPLGLGNDVLPTSSSVDANIRLRRGSQAFTGGKEVALRRARSMGFHDARLSPSFGGGPQPPRPMLAEQNRKGESQGLGIHDGAFGEAQGGL